MDNISVANFSASDKDSDTKRHKKSSNNFKGREDNGKKHRKDNSSLHCSLHGENKSHTSRECNILKKRAKYKDNTKYGKRDYKNKFKELNLLQAEADHQKSKYENLNKAFAKNKTSK